MKLIALLISAVLGSQTAPTIRPGTTTTGDIALAVAAVPRFSADRFVSLPPTVREAFVAMNCQVPQTALSTAPANVVVGEFATKGQRDWAALCSDGTVTDIRLVWGGTARCEDRVAARQDADTLVASAPGTFAYARSISVRPGDRFDVIEDAVANGPRLIHACRNGHWQFDR